MSFDQNTIIDATTGSIARFVNHSCAPNCRMIKWIVSGQPRMALFAGDRPIMTGEELTYDYNFDPFSAKNVQKCLCGSDNCRGVLGPRPKELKPPKVVKTDLKKAVKAGKRKLKEMLGDKDADGSKAAKKRKMKTATGISAKASAKAVQRSISAASLKVAKNAAAKVVKSVSTISVNAKAPASKKVTTVKRKTSVVKTYSKTKTVKKPAAVAAKKSTTPSKLATPKKATTPQKTTAASTPSKLASRGSASTIVAAAGEKGSPAPAEDAASPSSPDTTTNETPTRSPPKKGVASPSPRKAIDIHREANRIRLVQSPGEQAAA